MCRHVVGAFVLVLVLGRFGRQSIETRIEILANGLVGVLVDGKRGRRVLNEEMKNAGFWKLADRLDDFVGDEMKSF